MDPYKALATHIEAKEYLAEKEIPQLFEVRFHFRSISSNFWKFRSQKRETRTLRK